MLKDAIDFQSSSFMNVAQFKFRSPFLNILKWWEALYKRQTNDNDTEVDVHNVNRKTAKFFGVGLVRFENSVCVSASNLNGTCYRRRQCVNIAGVASGTCASGIGVCCLVLRTCGETSSYNNTYFSNTGFPSPVTTNTRCTMTIERCNPDICQVRIDFLSLILAQPNAVGVCTTDALVITGGGGPVPVICGDNSGQHVYVDFNGNDTIIMTISTTGAALGRIWNIQVTQIACACPTRAPAGCLMFYTAVSGLVNSFNYGVGGNVIDATTGLPGTRELANENYGVCVAMIPGYCSIQWASNAFVVSGVPGAGFDALTNGDCTTDFVVIPNPTYTATGLPVGSDRFCGTSFMTVTTASKPFVLTVVTNGDEINDVSNQGFSLTYTQLPCTNDMLIG